MKLIITIPNSVARISPTNRDHLYIMRFIRNALLDSSEKFPLKSGEYQLLQLMAETKMEIEK